jgi:hypothetical protein
MESLQKEEAEVDELNEESNSLPQSTESQQVGCTDKCGRR